jgi:hypothetical protein
MTAKKAPTDWISEALAEGGRKDMCGVMIMLASLSPGDADGITAALDNPSVTAEGLRRVLTRRIGNSPSGQTIRRHRLGQCSCKKETHQ